MRVVPEVVKVVRGPEPGGGARPGRGAAGLPEPGGERVLAAGVGGAAGAEGDFLLLPGGVERLQVVRLRIGLGPERREGGLVELRVGERGQRREDRRVAGAALRQPLGERREDMARLADQLDRLGRLARGRIFEEQRQVVRHSLRVGVKPPSS